MRFSTGRRGTLLCIRIVYPISARNDSESSDWQAIWPLLSFTHKYTRSRRGAASPVDLGIAKPPFVKRGGTIYDMQRLSRTS